MWKGDKGDEGLCCWLPASSTVCAGTTFQQSRYNPNTEPPGTEYRNAVGTGACQCSCGGAQPINPPGDPDFTKKLRGDPGVAPFTQVSLTYNIIAAFGSYSTQASGSMSGDWSDGENCFNKPLKVFVGSVCDVYGSCGACSKYQYNSQGYVYTTGEVFLKLENTGCLRVELREGASVTSVALSGVGQTPSDFGSGTDCSIPDTSGNLSITINGVSYPAVKFDPFGGFSVTASIDITFS